ncbi:pyrimidine 5'-nucleotidase [Alphaproteobacteria bacterium]|nr:pyrimidine 5'-nucleotidase [Alphaproteobacteria bacterium]MDC0131695.1 pyrimidine 5'-nucleotidase [Alphaproteobacteria bacterium]MDC0148256.1 pyrimidine 5'-nucleotidase [Alphaproteobacteria bacterium]
MQNFGNIDSWVFDLDNTLYPTDYNLFHQIDVRMTGFIQRLLDVDQEEAYRLQKDYLSDYGTTLSGLMNRHNMVPDAFLEFVHDIDVSVLSPAPELAKAIEALPGQKFIFTNGTTGHADRVAERLGVRHLFTDVFDIVAAGYVPKPNPDVYPAMLKKFDIDANRSVFFEDLARNLAPARKLGMKTVLVHHADDDGTGHVGLNGSSPMQDQNFIDHRTTDLTHFLNSVLQALTLEQ